MPPPGAPASVPSHSPLGSWAVVRIPIQEVKGAAKGASPGVECPGQPLWAQPAHSSPGKRHGLGLGLMEGGWGKSFVVTDIPFPTPGHCFLLPRSLCFIGTSEERAA